MAYFAGNVINLSVHTAVILLALRHSLSGFSTVSSLTGPGPGFLPILGETQSLRYYSAPEANSVRTERLAETETILYRLGSEFNCTL